MDFFKHILNYWHITYSPLPSPDGALLRAAFTNTSQEQHIRCLGASRPAPGTPCAQSLCPISVPSPCAQSLCPISMPSPCAQSLCPLPVPASLDGPMHSTAHRQPSPSTGLAGRQQTSPPGHNHLTQEHPH